MSDENPDYTEAGEGPSSPIMEVLRRWLEAQRPRRPPQDSLDQAVAKVLRGCRLCLREDGGSGAGPSAKPDDGGVLALAVLTAKACGTGRRKLWDQPAEKVAWLARPQLPRLRLWEAVLRCRGTKAADAVRDRAAFAHSWRLAARFERAISPERLSSLVRKPKRELRDRVRIFLKHREAGPQRYKAHRRKVLRRKLTAAQRGACSRQVGAARLLTFRDRKLAEVAGHFDRWEEVVRYIQDPELRQSLGEPLEARFLRLRERLIERLNAQWREKKGAVFEIGDAVHEELSRGLAGYTYESSLPHWLTKVVYNRLCNAARRGALNVSLEDDVPTPDKLPHVEWCELLLSWALRFQLVQATFRPRTRLIARQVWRSMLRSTWGRRPSNLELAVEISDRLGIPVTPLKVSMYRRRIHQRLEVLQYILDETDPGGKDAPDRRGDESVLACVEKRHGIHRTDVPTLRYLAAMARVGRFRRHAAWAVLAALLVNERLSLEEAKSIVRHLAGDEFLARLESRQDRLARLWNEPHARKNCRRSLRRARLLFFTTAVLWLVLVEEANQKTIDLVLQPAKKEGPPVRDAAAKVSELLSGGPKS